MAYRFPAVGLLDGLYILDNVISPAALTGNVNNWAPTGIGDANVLFTDDDGSNYNITGLLAPSPAVRQVLRIIHNGSGTPTLMDSNVLSTAANRFQFAGNLSIQTDIGVTLMYDPSISRWRHLNRG